jgi:hypothetical protein
MRNASNKSFPVVLLIVTLCSVICAKFLLSASKPQPEAKAPNAVETPVRQTPEHKQFVREAHRLGTRLFAVSKRADDLELKPAVRQQRLQPVYSQIEDFILGRLSKFDGRISSITVNYDSPGLQCMIFVKPGEDAELAEIKKVADSCVGKIVEHLPMVQYLMIRNDEPLASL